MKVEGGRHRLIDMKRLLSRMNLCGRKAQIDRQEEVTE